MMAKFKSFLDTPWTWRTYLELCGIGTVLSAIGYLLWMLWFNAEIKGIEDKCKETAKTVKKSKWVTIE